MDINSLSSPNWFQRMEANLISAASLIGALDSNSDGSLGLSEVEAALNGNGSTSQTGVSSTDPLAQAFAKLDTNGDGQLSQSELASAMQTMEQDASQVTGWGHRHHHHHHDADQAQASNTTTPAGASSVTSTAATTGSGGTSDSSGSASSGASA